MKPPPPPPPPSYTLKAEALASALLQDEAEKKKPFIKSPLAYIMAVLAGAIAAPTGLVISPVVLLLSNLKGEYTTKKGQKITPLASWIGAGIVLTPLCWVANQTMFNNPSPPKETKAEEKLAAEDKRTMEFCRTVPDVITPEDKTCGRFFDRIKAEQKQELAAAEAAQKKAREAALEDQRNSARRSEYLQQQNLGGSSTCFVGPRGGTYTLTRSGKKNYGGC